MSKDLYADYSINDFDKYDCLKLSKGIYLLLLFVLRGYIIWLISVTNMQDRVSTIQMMFPETSMFYLSLLSGAIGLFMVLVIGLRKPDAPNWIKVCWRHCRKFLVVALCFDLLISSIGFFYWQIIPLNLLLSYAIVAIIFIGFIYSSQKVSLNISEFPEKLPE
jgi:polyferredoxin